LAISLLASTRSLPQRQQHLVSLSTLPVEALEALPGTSSVSGAWGSAKIWRIILKSSMCCRCTISPVVPSLKSFRMFADADDDPEGDGLVDEPVSCRLTRSWNDKDCVSSID